PGSAAQSSARPATIRSVRRAPTSTSWSALPSSIPSAARRPIAPCCARFGPWHRNGRHERCRHEAEPLEGGAMKVLIKSSWGSADPTQAAFAFHHANAFVEAGHEVQIFLLGEAVSLMRSAVTSSIVPVGWQPLAGVLPKLVERRVPTHV